MTTTTATASSSSSAGTVPIFPLLLLLFVYCLQMSSRHLSAICFIFSLSLSTKRKTGVSVRSAGQASQMSSACLQDFDDLISRQLTGHGACLHKCRLCSCANVLSNVCNCDCQFGFTEISVHFTVTSHYLYLLLLPFYLGITPVPVKHSFFLFVSSIIN